MEHHASSRFWDRYDNLPARVQEQADKQFAALKANPQHPSLHFKKVGERDGEEVWSARVSKQYRALAIKTEDGFLWFWIGEHDLYDKMIQQQ